MKRGAPRRIDQPRPGYFLLRLVRHGPKVAARIVCEQDSGRLLWRAEIDGKWHGAWSVDPEASPGVMRIWTSGEMVAEAEFRFRLALRDWALEAAPVHPAANPRRPIDLATLPPLF